jgi:hypothetical protein
MKRIIIVLTLFPIFLSAQFYVSTNGSDANSGTFASPFKNIQRGVNVVSAIQSVPILYIGPGVYTQNVYIKSNKNSPTFMILTSLTNTKRAVLRGRKNGIVITNAFAIIISNVNFARQSNFGITVIDGATNVRVVGCTIYSNHRGLHLKSRRMRALHNTFVSNFKGFYSTGTARISYRLRNNIFYGNSQGVNARQGTVISSTYNDTFGNVLNYSNMSPGTGSISNNPILASYDYTFLPNFLYLGNTSPCIDAGDPTDSVPIPSGNGRVDMGWLEWSPPSIFVTNTFRFKTSMITHTIHYTNYKRATTHIVIEDYINRKFKFVTNSSSSPAGWTNQWSTNKNPDQGWYSSDYKTVQPTSTNVRWVRFKRASIAGSTGGNLVYKVKLK